MIIQIELHLRYIMESKKAKLDDKGEWVKETQHYSFRGTAKDCIDYAYLLEKRLPEDKLVAVQDISNPQLYYFL